MVDFGDTSITSLRYPSVAPSVPVVNPVSDKSGEVLASGLTNTFNGITNGLNTLGDIFNQHYSNVAAKANAPLAGGIMTDIASHVNLLADAKDQGSMGTSEVYTRLRAYQNEVMANNPESADKIALAFNTLLSNSGLAPKMNEDTPAEKAQKAIVEAADNYGWLQNPKNTEEQNVALYVQHSTDLQKVQDIATKISLIQGQGNIVSETLKAQATTALHSVIASGMPWVQGQIDDGYKRLQGVSDPAQRAAIISDVNSKITSQIALVDTLRTSSNNGIDTSYMTAGFQSLLDDFKNVANGKETMDQYANESARQAALVEHQINLDPSTAAAFTLGKLTGYNNPGILEQTTAAATKIITDLKNDNPQNTPDILGNDKDRTSAFVTLRDSFNGMVKDGKADPATFKEANATLSNLFRSVSQHSHSNMDPTELNNFMAFIADPSVGKYLETHMSELTPDVAKNASAIVQQYYQSVGVDLVNERWGTANLTLNSRGNRGAGGQVEINKAITPMWNGSGIEFQVAPEYKNDAQIQAQAKSLTTDVAGPLNNMVRAQAHMQGTTDYTKVYNEDFAKRLWVANPPATPGDVTELKTSPTDNPNSGVADDSKGLTPVGYLDKVVQQESSGNPNAKSKTASASGLYGITDTTYKSYASRLGITGDKNDPVNQKLVATAITQDSGRVLKAHSLPVTEANLYAMHVLGGSDGPHVLTADAGDLLSDHVPPRVMKANPNFKGMTVGDFKSWAEGIMNG